MKIFALKTVLFDVWSNVFSYKTLLLWCIEYHSRQVMHPSRNSFFFFFNRSMLGFWVRFVILVEKSWDQWNGLYTPAKTHFLRVWKSPCFGRCHSPRTERRLSSNDVMFYPQQKKSTCVTTFAPIYQPLLASACLLEFY